MKIENSWDIDEVHANAIDAWKAKEPPPGDARGKWMAAKPKTPPWKAKPEPVKAAAPAPVPATSLVPLDVLGKEIVACANSGDKNLAKAEQLYKAAGLKLIEARDRTDNFKSFLKVECRGLSRARAMN